MTTGFSFCLLAVSAVVSGMSASAASGPSAGLSAAEYAKTVDGDALFKSVIAFRFGENVRDEILDDAERAFDTRFDDDRTRANRDPWLKPDMGAWQGEFWGKYMLAAAEVASFTEDAGLKKWLKKRAVAFVRKYQRDDGYLCTYADPDFLGGPGDARHRFAWNVWGRKYTMWALLEIARVSGAPELIVAARRMADHLIAQLDRRGLALRETGYFSGMPSCSVIIPVLRLYKATGDGRYLAFVKRVVADWDRADGASPNLIRNAFGDKPVHEWYPDDPNWAKAYEMMSCLEGVVEYAEIAGGDEGKRLLDAVVRIRDKIAGREYNASLGSVGERDKFRGAGAAGTAGPEHCDIVHWMRLNAALLRATGDAKAADYIERAYRGGFLAGILDGGKWCMQFVRPDGKGVPAARQVNMERHHCCVDNMPRGFVIRNNLRAGVFHGAKSAR